MRGTRKGGLVSSEGSESITREELPCGALFVGAGPASLAGAIHLADLVAPERLVAS